MDLRLLVFTIVSYLRDSVNELISKLLRTHHGKFISNMTFVGRDSSTSSSHSQAHTDRQGWLSLLFPLSSPKARSGERWLLDPELWPPLVMAFAESLL